MSRNQSVSGGINHPSISGNAHQVVKVSASVSKGQKFGKELRFLSIADFPEIGLADILYIDKTGNNLYYWDVDNSSYVKLCDLIDDSVESSLKTYSSQKIEAELQNKQAQINQMLETLAKKPNAYSKTTAEWNLEPTLISEKNALYIYTDYKVVEGVMIPGIKIGDGMAYVIDLPFSTDVGGVTDEERIFWNNKVTAFIDPFNEEGLILTKENYI